jgi:hypothetical protein
MVRAMGFDSGTISCRRFAVVGEGPASVDQNVLDMLAANALRPGDIGLPEEVEYGWSGGRHVLDGSFTFEHNVFADCLHFAMRVDTNRVPSSLKRAYRIMEEEAAAAQNPSGFISKTQKRDVKEIVGRKLDDELRTGRFRRSKLLPVLWDLPSATLYCNAGGARLEQLMELFERTFALTLSPLSAGVLALRTLEGGARRREYEDMRPTRFVHGQEGDGQWPEYPWVLKGPEPKDFIGNEFLLWLWHEAESNDGVVTTSAGDVSVMFDRWLDLDCAYGQSGRDSLRATGPSRMPEARDGLRTGKVPRRAGLVLEASGRMFRLTLNAETLAMSGVKLPDVENADTPRVAFEERAGMIREVGDLIDRLIAAFLQVRGSSSWEGHTGQVRRWIMHSAKPIAAVA